MFFAHHPSHEGRFPPEENDDDQQLAMNSGNTRNGDQSNLLALRRLLYRMERHENFVVDEDPPILLSEAEATAGDGNDHANDQANGKGKGHHDAAEKLLPPTAPPIAKQQRQLYQQQQQPLRIPHPQTWHSLLVRAQLCRDLWEAVASQEAEGRGPGRTDYLELSQRVDAACKRAHVLAEHARAKELGQARAQARANQSVGGRESPVDVVEHLFGAGPAAEQDEIEHEIEHEHEHEHNTKTTQELAPDGSKIPHNGQETATEEDYYDEFQDEAEESSSAASFKETPTSNNKTSNSHSTTTQELQKVQREQIEEAIAMMARQMKESTQGIQNRIQQQTESTLNELETVAEQNVADVTSVADKVQSHNLARKKNAFSSFATMIVLVGVFVVSLLTVFTIPKSPDANLSAIVFAKEVDGVTPKSPIVRLLTKAATRVRRSLFDEDYDEDYDEEDQEHNQNEGGEDKNEDEDEEYHDEEEEYEQTYKALNDEAERLQETERLEQLVRDTKQPRDDVENYNSPQRDEDEEGMLDDGSEEEGEDGDGEYEEEDEEEEEENDYEDEDEDKDDYDEKKGEVEDTNHEHHREQDDEEPDNPWGIDPVDETDLIDLQQQQRSNSRERSRQERRQQQRRQQQEQEQQERQPENDQESGPGTIEEVNVDDIFASLEELKQQATAASYSMEAYDAASGVASTEAEQDQQRQSFDPANAFRRDGVASRRVSPRELRVAAASNDRAALERHLELSPEHINRQDKRGFTALHFATLNQHVDIVRVLLGHFHEPDEHENYDDGDIDVHVETYGENPQTAFDLALGKFGIDHPVTKAFLESGWYDDFDYNGDTSSDGAEEDDAGVPEEDEREAPEVDEREMRRREQQKRREERERRLALLAEQERQVQQDKLNKLFGDLSEDDVDTDDESELEVRRSRLDDLIFGRDEL